MKRIVILFVLLTVGFLPVCGQEIISIANNSAYKPSVGPEKKDGQYLLYKNMRYRDYSKLYNAKDYSFRYDDPYSPFLSGAASYFIPGLGQTVCGEFSRGLGFFLGTEAMAVGTLISFISTPGVGNYYVDEQTVVKEPSAGDHIRNFSMLAGLCAMYVWNIVDAVNVAKIKDLYVRDAYEDQTEVYDDAFPLFSSREMRYRDYKNLYSTKGYYTQWGDPYSPLTCGVASALFPGLGQCVAGEWGRGALFLGGYVLTGVGFGLMSDSVEGESDDSILALPALALAGMYIWNICDAVKVAKIKNLRERDIRGQRTSLQAKVGPYFSCLPSVVGNNRMASGLSLRLSF